MKTLYLALNKEIMRNIKKIERELNVKIEIKGKNLMISGEEMDEFIAEKVFWALELGFKVGEALLLKKENYIFEKINIKKITRKKNLEDIRGRIIGTKGRTLEVIRELSGCAVVLKNNDVGIIGEAEDIKIAHNALCSLIRGSKQGNVYFYLEKFRSLKRDEIKRKNKNV